MDSSESPSEPALEPEDSFNQALIGEVHPRGWAPPVPAERYNLVALGGGTAGLVAALATAGLGGKAALIERRFLGGDCLNFGCVPSKAILASARAAHDIRTAGNFGIKHVGQVEIDFSQVMERMRRLRAELAPHDSARRLASMGVDVFFGQATFRGRDVLDVAGQTLRFSRAVVATGTRPLEPRFEGARDQSYLTNETIFSLPELPRRLIVIGGGPIGCELAQAFRRFGSEVQLVGKRERLLPKEDPAAARLVEAQFAEEGIELHLGWTTVRAEPTGDSKGLVIERKGNKKKLMADEILVAIGRQPNVEQLGLAAAGVRFSAAGVEVNDHLQTSNPAIFAAGDVCGRDQFTHAADAMARLCVQNALVYPVARYSKLMIPRCTYTDPEVAQIGLTADQARQRSLEIDTFRCEMNEVDRAVLDGQAGGFAVVHVRAGTDRIVGATIVSRHAGEMISELAVLMANGSGLKALSRGVHCYPTQAEALKKIADRYNRTRFSGWMSRVFARWLAWRR